MAEKTGNAQTRAKNKYNAKKYDSLRIIVPKGKKEKIKSFADGVGKSINGFVNEAIDEKMSQNSKV